MEIGLELQSIRFHRPGCYRLAVVCRVGERRLVHVSEPSEICAAPKWKTTAWRLQVQKDDVELQLQLRFYDGNSSDCRSLLEERNCRVAALVCCCKGYDPFCHHHKFAQLPFFHKENLQVKIFGRKSE